MQLMHNLNINIQVDNYTENRLELSFTMYIKFISKKRRNRLVKNIKKAKITTLLAFLGGKIVCNIGVIN